MEPVTPRSAGRRPVPGAAPPRVPACLHWTPSPEVGQQARPLRLHHQLLWPPCPRGRGGQGGRRGQGGGRAGLCAGCVGAAAGVAGAGRCRQDSHGPREAPTSFAEGGSPDSRLGVDSEGRQPMTAGGSLPPPAPPARPHAAAGRPCRNGGARRWAGTCLPAERKLLPPAPSERRRADPRLRRAQGLRRAASRTDWTGGNQDSGHSARGSSRDPPGGGSDERTRSCSRWPPGGTAAAAACRTRPACSRARCSSASPGPSYW